MALFNRDNYDRDYGYRGQGAGRGGWGQRLRNGWNRVENGVRDALDRGGYDRGDYGGGDYGGGGGMSRGGQGGQGGWTGNRGGGMGGGDWAQSADARHGWGGVEPMGPGFGDRGRHGGPNLRGSYYGGSGGEAGGYDRDYGAGGMSGGYGAGGGMGGGYGSGNRDYGTGMGGGYGAGGGGMSGGYGAGGGGMGGGYGAGGTTGGYGAGTGNRGDWGHRGGGMDREDMTWQGREYDGPPVAGRDSMGLADRGGRYGRDYDEGRWETDNGDPFGDRQSRTPFRVMRGRAGPGGNWGQGSLGQGGSGRGYDTGYRGWNQGIGDEPYYNSGETRGYDRGYRGRDWF